MENFKLTPEYRVYRYLETVFSYEPDRWIPKQTLVDVFPNIFTKSDSTSHDICSTLNAMRLRINEAASQGIINHIVLLNNNHFKIAKNKEEAEKYCKKDYDKAMKLLVRYYQNIGVIKKNGQGVFINEYGDTIDVIKFLDPFAELEDE